MKLFVLLSIAFAIPLFVSGCQDAAPAPATAKRVEAEIEGKTFTVSNRVWPRVAKVQGSLFAYEITTIAAKVPGRVIEVNCDLGDLVDAEQTLVKLDQREYELVAAQAEAQLNQARAAIGLKTGDPVEKLNPLNAPPSSRSQRGARRSQESGRAIAQALFARRRRGNRFGSCKCCRKCS